MQEMAFGIPGYSGGVIPSLVPHFAIGPQVFAQPKNFHPLTIDWLNNIPFIPTMYVIHGMNKFFEGVYTDGNWDFIDRAWVFGQDKRENAYVDIKNPSVRANDCVEAYLNDGRSTSRSLRLRHSYLGFSRPGGANIALPASAYIDTRCDLSTLSNYSLNSAACFFYMRSDRVQNQANSTFLFGVTDGTNRGLSMQVLTNTNIGPYYVNQTTSSTHGVSNLNGVWNISRTVSTQTAANSPTTSNTTNINSSAIPSGLSLYLFCQNSSGTPSTFTTGNDFISFFMIAGGGINLSQMRTRINTLANDLGWPNRMQQGNRIIF